MKSETVYFYNQKKNLGVASLSEIASYLNEHNQVKAVEN